MVFSITQKVNTCIPFLLYLQPSGPLHAMFVSSAVRASEAKQGIPHGHNEKGEERSIRWSAMPRM